MEKAKPSELLSFGSAAAFILTTLYTLGQSVTLDLNLFMLFSLNDYLRLAVEWALYFGVLVFISPWVWLVSGGVWLKMKKVKKESSSATDFMDHPYCLFSFGLTAILGFCLVVMYHFDITDFRMGYVITFFMLLAYLPFAAWAMNVNLLRMKNPFVALLVLLSVFIGGISLLTGMKDATAGTRIVGLPLHATIEFKSKEKPKLEGVVLLMLERWVVVGTNPGKKTNERFELLLISQDSVESISPQHKQQARPS